MKKRFIGLTVLALSLTGCGALFDAAIINSNYTDAEKQQAGQVKFISEKQAEKRCQYVTEMEQTGVDYNMDYAIDSAKIYLRLRAVKAGGNTVAITDKLVTKTKKTKKILLTASIYKCQ